MAKKAYFQLLNVDHTQEYLPDAFHISAERLKFLKKEILYVNKEMDFDKHSKAIEYLLQFCESLEEVIFMTHYLSNSRMKCPRIPLPVPEGFIRSLLESLRRSDEDED
jgi:hypothetical protein